MRTFPEGPDFYLTEPALEAAQAVGTIAVDCQVDELQAMLDYVEEQSDEALGGPLIGTSFVLMRGHRNPHRSEGHYFQAPPDYPLLPADQLGSEPTEWVPKYDLTEGGRHVLEVRPLLWHGSLSPVIARAVLGPRPEDHDMTAGFAAWGRQVIQAFTLPDAKKNAIQMEVQKRFPGAVMLRRSTDTTPPVAA